MRPLVICLFLRRLWDHGFFHGIFKQENVKLGVGGGAGEEYTRRAWRAGEVALFSRCRNPSAGH